MGSDLDPSLESRIAVSDRFVANIVSMGVAVVMKLLVIVLDWYHFFYHPCYQYRRIDDMKNIKNELI